MDTMDAMFDRIVCQWAAEFGQAEMFVSAILKQASRPLLDMIRRVAPEQEDPLKIDARRFGKWIGEHRGLTTSGWKFRDRIVSKQCAWRLVEVFGENPAHIAYSAGVPMHSPTHTQVPTTFDPALLWPRNW